MKMRITRALRPTPDPLQDPRRALRIPTSRSDAASLVKEPPARAAAEVAQISHFLSPFMHARSRHARHWGCGEGRGGGVEERLVMQCLEDVVWCFVSMIRHL